MPTIRTIVLSFALAASCPSFAHDEGTTPPAAKQALNILTHLDLNSFHNSTGPRRRLSAHTPADYGFTKIEAFPDGWAEISQADDGWHMTALLLEEGMNAGTLCFTDSAGHGGTYHSTRVLDVKLDKNARWTATEMPDRSDCKNAPPNPSLSGKAAGPVPAAILQHLDDFRDSLSTFDRQRLDRELHRSSSGGLAQCDHTAGSRASCEVAAYMPALHRVGLMPRFLTSPGPVSSASGLQREIESKGAVAVSASLSAAGWDVALDEATAGRADWIEAIASLRTATDGARSEAIDHALSDALSTNPSEVLRLIVSNSALPGVTWLCRDRSIEAIKTGSGGHIRAATAALRIVADPKLATVRDQCLANLDLG